MNIHDLIKHAETVVYGNDFHEALRAYYSKDANGGPCTEIEKDYEDARRDLLSGDEDEYTQILEKMESCCEANRDYAAEFGFKAGIACALSQMNQKELAPDGGFQKAVVEDLLMMPAMKRHGDFYSRHMTISELEEAASGTLDPEESDAVYLISCALSNRVYHASLWGFYTGYCAGTELIEAVNPKAAALSREKLRTVQETLEFKRAE